MYDLSMIRKEDIPKLAICHICGEPMKLEDISILAKRLGYKVAEGSYVLGCCDFELTVDDEGLANHLVKLLQAYHFQNSNKEIGKA
jgi:hypothetical protein